MRAKQWRDAHPDEAKKGQNIRDYASAEELVVLVNLESYNALWISQGLSQAERLKQLRTAAYNQMQILKKNQTAERLNKIANPQIIKNEE